MAGLQGAVLIQDDALTLLLNRLTQEFSPAGQLAILTELGRRVGRVVNLRYPPQSGKPLLRRYRWQKNGQLSKFKSWQHQRAFFGLLKRGQITIHYRRTGNLGRSPKFTIEVNGNEATVTMIFPEKYKYVIGKRGTQQSQYFEKQTQWLPAEESVSEQTPEIIQAVTIGLDTIFKDLG